eukprot:TRINITY_DN13061_c0_g1_i1.p1 TRINITY_DN13061_c0_g1~~TRINITY_DN13061_c0_g1_i1.p1  ORF type:complete len:295 (-),score=87.94 TRINITY_DN13061_c0_g1_i1:105-989(-)
MKRSREPPSELSFYVIDAFTDIAFSGNPAGVCLCKDSKLSVSQMRKVVDEFALPIVAFVGETEEKGVFSIRWFTPSQEIPLCGHGTLAAAYVLYVKERVSAKELTFSYEGGTLKASMNKDRVSVTLPQNVPQPIELSDSIRSSLAAALKLDVDAMLMTSYSETSKKLVVEILKVDVLKSLTPNFSDLLAVSFPVEVVGVIVTVYDAEVRSKKYNWVCRYFAPWIGVEEDPATGSVQTCLAPYFSPRIDQPVMNAYQVSKRGGSFVITLPSYETVKIEGGTRTVLRGYVKFPRDR